MRQIGRLANEIDARRLAAFLVQQNVDALVQKDNDGWNIWVRNEDQLESARDTFAHFLANPRDSRYQQAEKQVELTPTVQLPRRRRTLRIRMRRPSLFGSRFDRPDTVVAIVTITLLVTVGSWLPSGSISDTLERVLSFADTHGAPRAGDAFRSIKQGEVWRLITPIFLHFSASHILFNMVVFYYLGAQVERHRSPIALALLMVILAIISNTAQAYFAGPYFGGMSGVVYGLLGYVWMKSSYEPTSGFLVHPLILAIALVEFLFSLFVWQETVANYAHAGGLVMGILLGMAGRVEAARKS